MVESNVRVEVLGQRINELGYNTYIEQTEGSVQLNYKFKEATEKETGKEVNEKVEISIGLARSKEESERYLTTCNVTVVDENGDDGLILRKLSLRVLYEMKIIGEFEEIKEVRALLKEESLNRVSDFIEEFTEKDTSFPPIRINKVRLKKGRI